MKWLETKSLFAYEGTLAEALLAETLYPWEVLPKISGYTAALAAALAAEPGWHSLGNGVTAADSAVIAESAVFEGPAVIGPRTEVRPSAYFRGDVLVGADCLVGNAVELKNCVLLDGAHVARFNYVGDSVLGRCTEFAAGAVTANSRIDTKPVAVRDACGLVLETGLRKVGAMVGDGATVGCQAVLNPGTVVGKNARIYPEVSFTGVAREYTTVK